MTRETVERKVLSENDRLAAELRQGFEARGTLCVNLISSPGSGKTTLLERTLERLPADHGVAVLTGDVATDNDARRLARSGRPVRQIGTGGSCHLDAARIGHALVDWDLSGLRTLFIENVGNLICPTGFDLGEAAKVVLHSVTEGDDKPLKYPAAYVRSELLVVTKTDLLPHVPSQLEEIRGNALRVNPEIGILALSALTGEGMDGWLDWLAGRRDRMVAETGSR